MNLITRLFKKSNTYHAKAEVDKCPEPSTDLLTKESLQKKPFFCSLAFEHLYSDPGGLFKVCTEAYESPHHIGNTTIRDWYDSDYMTEIRKEMLSDTPNLEKLSMCSRCINAEKTLGSSLRTRLRDFCVPTIANANVVAKTGKIPFNNRFLNIQMRFFKNNVTCNLSCYMCFPKFSTKRQIDITETNGHELIPEFSVRKMTIHEPIEPIIDQFIQLAPNIRTIEVIGGEPLYIKEFFDFIEELVDRAGEECKKISLKIFTNLTHLTLNDRDFLTYAKNFKSVEFKISMDSFGKYNNYIRRNSDYENIWSNLERVREAGHPYLVWPTISTLSVLRYKELEDYLKKMNVVYQYNLVTDPDHLNVRHLPDKIKMRLIDELSDSTDIVNALKAERNESKFQQTMRYIRNLDKKYNTNVFDLFPELEEFVVKDN